MMNEPLTMTENERTLMFQHYEVFDRYTVCANELIQRMRSTAAVYRSSQSGTRDHVAEDQFSIYEEDLERLTKETFDYFNMVCRMMNSMMSMAIYGIPSPDNEVAVKPVSKEYRMKLRRLNDITLKGYHHFVSLEVETIRSALIDITNNGTIEVKFEPHALICSTIHSSNGRNIYGGLL